METDFIIEKLILELDFNSEQEFHQFSSYLENSLYPSLQQELDKILPAVIDNPTENIQIEQLEIELPSLSFQEMKSTAFVAQVKASFQQQINTKLIKQKTKKLSVSSSIPKNTESSTSFRQTILSRTQSLQHYLQTGQFLLGLEWKREELEKHFHEKSNQHSIIEWIEQQTSKTTQKQILQRLALQLPIQQSISFFEHSTIQNLNAIFSEPLVFSTAVKPSDSNQSTLIIHPHKGQLQKEDILQLPTKTAKSIEGTSDKNNLRKPQQSFYVKNAGIVIVAPYLHALFQKSELLESTAKAFKNEYCLYYAIHLLEFLANKSTLQTEDTSLLYKMLCGLPLTAPIATQIEIAEEDKARVDRLMLQVVRKWNIKFGDQIDLLRGSFFIRDGKLSKVDADWRLHVATKSYDTHLLKKLPWSFQRIKLPWMNHFLQVDWY